MSKIQFSIWIFPIIMSIIFVVLVFEVFFGRPVTGLIVGAIIGLIVGVITKLLFDEFFNQRNQVYEKKITSKDLMRIPRIFVAIWIIPTKLFLKFAGKFLIIFSAIAIVIYLLIKAVFNGL